MVGTERPSGRRLPHGGAYVRRGQPAAYRIYRSENLSRNSRVCLLLRPRQTDKEVAK